MARRMPRRGDQHHAAVTEQIAIAASHPRRRILIKKIETSDHMVAINRLPSL